MDKKFYSRDKKYVILYEVTCITHCKYESDGDKKDGQKKETF